MIGSVKLTTAIIMYMCLLSDDPPPAEGGVYRIVPVPGGGLQGPKGSGRSLDHQYMHSGAIQ